jgi:hypothetical protein
MTRHPNPLATDENAPLWVAESSYGTAKIYEYHPNTPDMVTYGHELGPFSRKMADQVAAALNSAYSLGLKHGTS